MEVVTTDNERMVRGATSVVVVDDDPHVLWTLARTLQRHFEVTPFERAKDAIERVRAGGVSVVVSDISMPEMTGLELLRAIREFDEDLPVVLITGVPTLRSAQDAIEFGVFRYVEKPYEGPSLRRIVERASHLYRLARLKREALELQGRPAGPSDRIGLQVTFRRALESLWIAFQPIVALSSRSVFGFEALLRSNDPALPTPRDVLRAAERLDAIEELGRLIRSLVASHARSAADEPVFFLNLHPRELMDAELARTDSELAPFASRIVLEVTERASLSGLDQVQAKVAALREVGFRVAVDDLGAGYAGLSSFALLEPDIVKVDMTLTRDVDTSAVKQKLVSSLTELCRDMGLTIVVEGVETVSERDTLAGLGCDLLQGYLFARPGPAFPEVQW